ncbi:Lon family ATP-dependent protease [Fervidicella metallireducens]|uniref:Lon family ATP-dependent protease n=1 Tax=Fervidicella metallireducens TaxID=655338 RepID=UPI0005511012
MDKCYKEISIQIDAIIELVKKIWGEEFIEKTVEEKDLSKEIESDSIEDKIYALQKMILDEDNYIDDPIDALNRIEKEIALLVARTHIENKIEEDVERYLEEKQEKFIDEIRLNIIKKQRGGENSKTIKKLEELQKLEKVKLSKSIMEIMRPARLNEIIGQDIAVKCILSKLASPYPQHILLYGPPGVGKTTAARLALDITKKIKYTPFRKNSPFIEVDGTTLRWDPREIMNPLLGSVHDPIYMGAKRDLAEGGIPEPKTGLVTDAHGGVLFIDEIGELDIMLQNKLLKVLEDKRVNFSSSYYDPDDENVPAYIKKLFNEGAPADFILIGATTRSPEEINPALRSRCMEVYFQPLSKKDIIQIVKNAAEKLKITMDENVPEIISQYTMEGRKAVNILADIYGYVVYNRGNDNINITEKDAFNALALSRLIPHCIKKAFNKKETGSIFGLGVNGFIGSTLEIEAVAFRNKNNDGKIRFNDTAGSMAKDSVFNASSVIRKIIDEDISAYDIHVNIVGGGNVDGPSAGAAITVAMLSAVTGKPVRQDVAVTGEISLTGNIKPVGGIIEKIHGAIQAGIKTVLIPEKNKKDIPSCVEGIEIIPVSHINEVLELVF